jgi:zinc-ribbon domain
LIAINMRASNDETMPGMLRTLILAWLLLPGLAGAANGAPWLERLQVEIWPEYDRPAALVILKGEIAADVALPAALALRIPASSGGPAAVAYAAVKSGPLLNLPYDRSAAGGFITLRFSVPERFFHVEFYDPLATGSAERSYAYSWPGDLELGALHVVVQEPAAARGISIQPDLGPWSTGSDGLRYGAADLGPAPQGTSRSVEIRYAKSDPRTSAEILKLGAPAASPSAFTSSEEQDAFRLFLAAAAFAVLVLGSSLVYFLWWRRRARANANFCGKCGNALADGDRFCPKCGAARA